MSLSYLPITAPEPGHATELLPGVIWIRLPLPYALDHINVWLLREEAGWTLVDTGLATSRVRGIWAALLEELGAHGPIGRILVTHHHPDHLGLARWLADRLEVSVWMTAPELEDARALYEGRRERALDGARAFYAAHGLDPDGAMEDVVSGRGYNRIISGVPARVQPIEDGEALRIGAWTWRARVVGGHARGHLCLHAEQPGLLIAGDQVLPGITSNVSLLPWDSAADPLGDFLDSLDSLGELPADTRVLPSHGLPFEGLHARLEALRAHHEATLDRVRELCGSPPTAAELIPRLFSRELDGFNLFLAMGETLAHLAHLVERGELRRIEDAARVRWEAC